MTFSIVIRELTSAAGTGERATSVKPSLLGEAEFRAFYDRTARPLRAYLARITGDRQLADDLLQETYYRFYRAGDVHEDEKHRRNSLFMIATNLARDSHRRRSGHVEAPLEEADIRFAHETPVYVRTDLRRALAQLKPQQRELLWLAYAVGSSHEEIAEVTGVSRSSVKSLLLRARRKLAAMLGEGIPRRSNDVAE